MQTPDFSTYFPLGPFILELLPSGWSPTRTLRTDRLWSLLEDAVDDCEAVEQLIKTHPHVFSWDMDFWIEEGYGGCCFCMAGASLLRRGRGDTYWDTPTWMRAIDAMRCGNFEAAYRRLYEFDDVLPFSTIRALNHVTDRFQELWDPDDDTPPSTYLTWDGYREVAAILMEYDL